MAKRMMFFSLAKGNDLPLACLRLPKGKCGNVENCFFPVSYLGLNALRTSLKISLSLAKADLKPFQSQATKILAYPDAFFVPLSQTITVMRKLELEELKRDDYKTYRQKPKLPVTVVLDNIRSMYNVGAVFRTCDAFLVEKLYLCGITAKPPHREIQKTAIGATESVEWAYYDKAKEAVQTLKNQGYQIIGVEQTDESHSLSEISINADHAYALLMGNEVAGLSEDLLEDLDRVIAIPQFGTKHSLNIAVSSGIVIWEFVKPFLKSHS